MFTGIVEEIGQVARVERSEGVLRLAVDCRLVHEGAAIGDSIAVNGVCLTIVTIEGACLAFEAVPETLRRTNLGSLEVGHPVNLERAVGPSRFMGGHYVQGHVDATGEVQSITPDGEAQNYRFWAPSDVVQYLVPKGYVTVDGASLTVVDVFEDGFSVSLVPHTQKSVVMGSRGAGYRVNLEVDVVAKYAASQNTRLRELERRVTDLEQQLCEIRGRTTKELQSED